MKNKSTMSLKTVTALALAASVAALGAAPAFAAGEPTAVASKTMVITPLSLRTALLKSNYGVIESLNQIHQAKDQVNIARAGLLPSLNLGAMLSAITAGPAFALSSISFLMPFLIPTNWANLHQSEDLLESQKIGYRLVELNNYASAYSLYATMQGDVAVREALVAEYNDFVGVRDYLINQQRFVGNVAQEDIDRADSEVNLALANISATDEMLVKERAQLRQALALPHTTNVVLSDEHVSPSAAEGLPITKVAAMIQNVAPENAQMVYLVKAAQQVRFSKEFSFFSGATLNVGVSSGGSPQFNKLDAGSMFNLSFATIPNVQLANDNIDYLYIQERDLLSQQAELADQTINAIIQAKLQVTDTTLAETELDNVFSAELRKYTLGLTDELNVLDAERTKATATATKAKAMADLDNLRVTLHRELLTDMFKGIPGCRIRPEAEQMDKNFLGRLFSPSKYVISIDQACAAN